MMCEFLKSLSDFHSHCFIHVDEHSESRNTHKYKKHLKYRKMTLMVSIEWIEFLTHSARSIEYLYRKRNFDSPYTVHRNLFQTDCRSKCEL